MPRAKGNRTDLNGPAKLPDVTAPGQEYGRATDQRDAMKAVPMGPPPALSDASTVTPATALPPANSGPGPGELPFLEPSQSGLPITHGLPMGAGAGPEAMGNPPVNAHPITQAFDDLASSPNASTAVSTLADASRLLGL